ncbi:hypothetical protein ACHAW6_015667 [Cyclotella cf. meneghiniana]
MFMFTATSILASIMFFMSFRTLVMSVVLLSVLAAFFLWMRILVAVILFVMDHAGSVQLSQCIVIVSPRHPSGKRRSPPPSHGSYHVCCFSRILLISIVHTIFFPVVRHILLFLALLFPHQAISIVSNSGAVVISTGRGGAPSQNQISRIQGTAHSDVRRQRSAQDGIDASIDIVRSAAFSSGTRRIDFRSRVVGIVVVAVFLINVLHAQSDPMFGLGPRIGRSLVVLLERFHSHDLDVDLHVDVDDISNVFYFGGV